MTPPASAGGVGNSSTLALAIDLAERGIQGILACGATGEAVTLSDDERTAPIEAVWPAVPAEGPVLAGRLQTVALSRTA